LDIGTLFKAFANLRPRLGAVAQARTGSRATADDLMQETWLKLGAVRSGEPIKNPNAFVRRIAENTITDHIRKERRRVRLDSELAEFLWDVTDEMSPERALISQERLRAVQSALAKMPERTRTIFLRNRIDGVPHRQIAEELGISCQAVYYHIRRALEALAELRDQLTL
jgi:RNA polymerase sigma-70 factor (ECF subfamily)